MKALYDYLLNASVEDFIFSIVVAAFLLKWLLQKNDDK